MEAELIEKIQEAEDTFSFIFRPEIPFKWRAGQYACYRLPHRNPDNRGIKRYFSIASAPHEEYIMLTTRIDPENGSTFKKALYNRRPGSTVEIIDRSGSFTVGDYRKKYLMLAGGIGITPFRSILLDIDHKGMESDIVLIYGNKTDDIAFKGILDELETKNKWLTVDYVIGPRRIDGDIIKDNTGDMHNSMYYLSGPMAMVRAIKDILLGMDINAENIKTDYFPGYS